MFWAGADSFVEMRVPGRAQRLLWLEMPVRSFQPQEDGIERFTMEHDFEQWKLSERAPGEPWIWRESHWRMTKENTEVIREFS